MTDRIIRVISVATASSVLPLCGTNQSDILELSKLLHHQQQCVIQGSWVQLLTIHREIFYTWHRIHNVFTLHHVEQKGSTNSKHLATRALATAATTTFASQSACTTFYGHYIVLHFLLSNFATQMQSSG